MPACVSSWHEGCIGHMPALERIQDAHPASQNPTWLATAVNSSSGSTPSDTRRPKTSSQPFRFLASWRDCRTLRRGAIAAQ